MTFTPPHFYLKYVVWSKVNVLVVDPFSRMIRCQQPDTFLEWQFLFPASQMIRYNHSVSARTFQSTHNARRCLYLQISLFLKRQLQRYLALSRGGHYFCKARLQCLRTILALTCDHIFYSAQCQYLDKFFGTNVLQLRRGGERAKRCHKMFPYRSCERWRKDVCRTDGP